MHNVLKECYIVTSDIKKKITVGLAGFKSKANAF